MRLRAFKVNGISATLTNDGTLQQPCAKNALQHSDKVLHTINLNLTSSYFHHFYFLSSTFSLVIHNSLSLSLPPQNHLPSPQIFPTAHSSLHHDGFSTISTVTVTSELYIGFLVLVFPFICFSF